MHVFWYKLNPDHTTEPCSIEEANELLGKNEERRVGESWLNDYRISTVFLALDHGDRGENNTPILFETMIFGDGDLDGETWRYETWEEAERGHMEACEVVDGLGS